MISTIFIFVAWTLSILIAWGNVHVTKGVDWYTPITNQHRILLVFLNSAMSFSIAAFFIDLLLLRFTDFIVWNVFMLALFSVAVWLDFSKGKIPGKNKTSPSDNGNWPSNTRRTIVKFMTIFCVIYYICTFIYAVGYSSVIHQGADGFATKSVKDFLLPVAQLDNTFMISCIILFWGSLFTAVLSIHDWFHHKGESNNAAENSLKLFVERVRNRGRKG